MQVDVDLIIKGKLPMQYIKASRKCLLFSKVTTCSLTLSNVYWVQDSKFMIFFITIKGIKMKLDKVKEILEISELRNIKEVKYHIK